MTIRDAVRDAQRRLVVLDALDRHRPNDADMHGLASRDRGEEPGALVCAHCTHSRVR
jgi:putative N-acetylmannosamine-6-phosphate epimerase